MGSLEAVNRACEFARLTLIVRDRTMGTPLSDGERVGRRRLELRTR